MAKLLFVRQEFQANIRALIVQHESQADLKAYISEQAPITATDLVWHFVNHARDASSHLSFVQHAEQANLRVMFVEHLYDAHWIAKHPMQGKL